MTEMFDGASSFNQCLSTWAKKTSDSVNTTNTTSMLNGTSCTSDYVNPTFGPLCQDAFNGCIVPTSAPSASLRPTVQPSTSAAPSTSAVPSTSVAPSFLPSLSAEPSTSVKPSINEACPRFPEGGCNVCGDGKCISQPNAIFKFNANSEESTCGELQEAGLDGQIGPSQCPNFQEAIREDLLFINCECTTTGVVPTVALTAAPTQHPSVAPTVASTAAPSKVPTKVPTKTPSMTPTSSTTKVPTDKPTKKNKYSKKSRKTKSSTSKSNSKK